MTGLTKNTFNLADLVISTLQSSWLLYFIVRGLLSQSPIPKLIEPLKALNMVLEKLAQILTIINTKFIALELPLQSYSKCCKEFNK